MNMKRGLLFAVLAPLPVVAVSVDDLVSRMTLEEKVGQLVQVSGADPAYAASTDMSKAEIDRRFYDGVRNGDLGVLLGCRGIENFNAVQKTALESRLGIPLIVGHDMIHGAITDYPIPLANSCSWDADLWTRVGEAIGAESILLGCNWTFAPMMDIARDARWGRIAESAGQDPYLASLYAAAMTKGVQRHIAACAKHYVAYGAAESGRDYNKVEMSDSTLRDVYLPPFKAAVEAGLMTVMPAFHTYNDVPCSVNRYLLRDILRDEFGFKGFTISDYNAVRECAPFHHGVAEGDEALAAAAIKGGMDVDMMGGVYRLGLAKAVRAGLVDEKLVDESVRNVLRVKLALGLFEHPLIDPVAASNKVDFAANRALAREAAAKSVVLLKNDGKRLLPLDKTKKIVVVGHLANDRGEMHGMWSTHKDDNIENMTLVEGLRADGVEVSFARCFAPYYDEKADLDALAKAVEGADLVIACFGESITMNGENTSRADIGLPGDQDRVVEALAKSGKPFVAVLFNGRPLAIPRLVEAANAVVEAWNPGGCGGWGVADVLTGAAEPYGRLTADFPHLTGECPKYYNRLENGRAHYKPSKTIGRLDKANAWNTKYLDAPMKPLFPFGYGLTYTTFAYADRKVEVKGDTVVFSAKVTNTGARKGSEVVQVYVRDIVASISRPIRELKGFRRVELAPGETRSVEIAVPVASLGFHLDGKYVVEPGDFLGWICSDSDEADRHLDATLSFKLK